MKVGFIVGEIEQHQMELAFDQTSGELHILMDGTTLLQDTPRLARNTVKLYELNIGNCEQHKLTLQLAFGNGLETDEPGFRAVPRLSLNVTAVPPTEVAPESLGLNGTDSLLAANTAATV